MRSSIFRRRKTYEEKDASNGPDTDSGTPFDDLFDKFLHHPPRGDNDGDSAPQERSSNSLGSGFVIDPSGIIITNNHVIADSNEVTVIFTDGTKLRARVIGKDSKVDVAVLKVQADHPLKSVKFGDSDQMRVGDWVIAVGNPFGLGGSVTAGIVSAPPSRHRSRPLRQLPPDRRGHQQSGNSGRDRCSTWTAR